MRYDSAESIARHDFVKSNIMEPENNLQKNIGITISILVMLGVLFVTIFWGKQTTNTGAANQILPNNPVVSLPTPTTPIPVISPIATPTPKPKPTPSVPAPVIPPTPPPIDIPKSVYKDGTYSAIGSYMSPGGYDQIGVSVTLKNDIITGASVTNMGVDRRSQRYQDQFISGYQQYVVGQNIANVFLTKISGASLTPSGFNDALTQIKAQAKA
jgi:uncharacterized protein with FMN-binding domain